MDSRHAFSFVLREPIIKRIGPKVPPMAQTPQSEHLLSQSYSLASFQSCEHIFVIEDPKAQKPVCAKSSKATETRKPRQWLSRVQTFLAHMPQNDADWEMLQADEVSKLRDRLTMAHIPQARRSSMGWGELFLKCCRHKQSLSDREIAFFELVYTATSFLALKHGYNESDLNQAMRDFNGSTQRTIGDRTLSRKRAGSIRGIHFLNVVTHFQGTRALSLPRYGESVWVDLVQAKV